MIIRGTVLVYILVNIIELSCIKSLVFIQLSYFSPAKQNKKGISNRFTFMRYHSRKPSAGAYFVNEKQRSRKHMAPQF